MDEMIKDVEQISSQLIPILGYHFNNLLDENDIFDMVEEHQHESSEERVTSIVDNILTVYSMV